MDYQKQAEDFATKTGTTMRINGSEFKKHFDTDEQEREVYSITLARKGEEYTFSFGSSISDSCKLTPAIVGNGKCEGYTGIYFGQEKMCMFRYTIQTDYPTLLKIEGGEMTVDEFISKRMPHIEAAWQEGQDRLKQANAKARYAHMRKTYSFPLEQAVSSVKGRLNKMISEAHTNMVLLERADNPVPPTMYDILTCLTKSDPVDFENFCSEYGYDTDSRKAYSTYEAVQKEWKGVKRLFGDVLDELQEIQ